jgi:hypothetical protein
VHRDQQNDLSAAPRSFPHAGVDRALLACSLWLYLGFIGAAAFGGGLILLFEAHSNAAVALAIVIFGALLAPTSWLAGWRAARAAPRETAAARGPITDDCAELAAWPRMAALQDSRRR